ncbi:MAG TPA: acetyltransferase [Anaerolineae bacterium]|nr:acetyltransferase [Anaerolineae bacterium]
MKRILVIGAGGHAQVAADMILSCARDGQAVMLAGFLDDDQSLLGQTLFDVPVWGTIAEVARVPHDAVVIGIGDNATRARLYEQLLTAGEAFTTVIHPRATLAQNVSIGSGTVVFAGAVVNTGAVLGANVIINTSASVDHHARIGAHVHIAPGAHLGGDVTIEEGALIGIGATVMPRKQIGAWSVVGAGACVTKSVAAGLIVVGLPAKQLQDE